MAPLPPNSTACVWVDYDDGFNNHSLQIRYDFEVVDASFALGAADAFLAALSPQLYLITITGARARASGSIFTFPVTWDGDDTYGTGAMPDELAPRQICYLARSATGRRVRWYVWGCKLETPGSYRFSLADNSDLAAAHTIIIGSQVGGAFLAIDGTNPTMYPFIDINFNSYYEGKARG